MPRILVADDHALMRRGMRDLLATQDGWQVCGEAANGREAVEMAIQQEPDIVVLDLSMPQLNGLEAARQILERVPQIEILIFTMHETEELLREVLASGARGCVLKTDMENHLVAAVQALLQHSLYFSHQASKTLKEVLLNPRREKGDDPPSEELTDREREIVRLLAQAKSNKEIATALSISVRTVETHRAAIMRKLEINSIVELVHYAVRKKLVQIESDEPKSKAQVK
jgi:DNA-binding NarL/FixJ family response regulator